MAKATARTTAGATARTTAQTTAGATATTAVRGCEEYAVYLPRDLKNNSRLTAWAAASGAESLGAVFPA